MVSSYPSMVIVSFWSTILVMETFFFSEAFIMHNKCNSMTQMYRIPLSSLQSSSIKTEMADSICKTAEAAARKAGKLILEGSGNIDLDGGVESKIGSRDIVTAVDKNAQDVIKETILSAFPDHSFLGCCNFPIVHCILTVHVPCSILYFYLCTVCMYVLYVQYMYAKRFIN